VLDWAWRSAARSRPNPLGQRGSMNPTHLPLSSAQHQHPNMCGVLDIPKLHNVYYVEHAFEHTPQQAKSNATSCLNEQVQPPPPWWNLNNRRERRASRPSINLSRTGTIKFDDEIQGLFLLGSLPDSWETFRMSLSNFVVDGVLSMDLVKSSVLNDEMRRMSQRFLYTEDKDKDKEDSSDGESTHLQLDDLLLVEEHGMSNVVDNASSWMIDSGTSVHVASRRDIFSSYTSGEFGDVKLAHDGVLKCVGLGDVNLEMANGSKLTLKDVKHVSDIRLNLLSVVKLCDEGYNSLFSRDTWKLTKGSMIVARGIKCSTHLC
ncbi:multidrug and toxin extrusion protein 2-like, partial [Trifolium pratense]